MRTLSVKNYLIPFFFIGAIFFVQNSYGQTSLDDIEKQRNSLKKKLNAERKEKEKEIKKQEIEYKKFLQQKRVAEKARKKSKQSKKTESAPPEQATRTCSARFRCSKTEDSMTSFSKP